MVTTELRRWGGLALVVAALGTVFTMAHHPSGAHSGGLGPLVHGAMILLVGLMAFGFAATALERGAARPLILSGLVAYAISVVAHIGAATINGFVVPALAARGHGAVSHDIFLLAWQGNQALARLGVAATGIAFLLWSADLAGSRRGSVKALAAAGVIAGLLPIALLAGGLIRMNVAGAFLTYALQAAWMLWVGLALLRGALMPDPGRANVSPE